MLNLRPAFRQAPQSVTSHDLAISKDTTVEDFLRDVLRHALTNEEISVTGSTVWGGVVFRYRLTMERCEVFHDGDPETRH